MSDRYPTPTEAQKSAVETILGIVALHGIDQRQMLVALSKYYRDLHSDKDELDYRLRQADRLAATSDDVCFTPEDAFFEWTEYAPEMWVSCWMRLRAQEDSPVDVRDTTELRPRNPA